MSFLKRRHDNRIIFDNLEKSAITQIQFINLLGKPRLEIQTNNKDIKNLFVWRGGTSIGDVVFIDDPSKELIKILLEEVLRIAGIGIGLLREISTELDVSEPYITGPLSLVETSRVSVTAGAGFFGGAAAGAGGASASTIPISAQVRDFLQDVAEGKEGEADASLSAATPANIQILLRTPGVFTDYSGRTFYCTAYEYAYWAKDTHMCRMLERHMDEKTKAYLLARIEAMEESSGQGLTYQQNGKKHHSVHFDLTPLKTAWQAYISGYPAWYARKDWAAMDAALMDVAKEQRNVPAHVAQQCRNPDLKLYPLASFNVDREDIPKEALPRDLTIINAITGRHDSWFPLATSNSGLGFDFAVRVWGVGINDRGAEGHWSMVSDADLMVVTSLDEARTSDLATSRKNLSPPSMSHGLSR
jgi:hypothetical protein